MTIRCGMTGDVVQRIEKALAALKLHNWPVDFTFGGGVAADMFDTKTNPFAGDALTATAS